MQYIVLYIFQVLFYENIFIILDKLTKNLIHHASQQKIYPLKRI